MQLADTFDPVVDSLWIALGPADASDTLSYRNNDIIPTLKYQHDKSIHFLVIIVRECRLKWVNVSNIPILH